MNSSCSSECTDSLLSSLPSLVFGAFGVVNGKLFCCDVYNADKLCGWLAALVDAASLPDGILNVELGGVFRLRSWWMANSGSMRPTCIFNFSNTSLCCKFGRFCRFGTPIKLLNMLNAWLGPNAEWWLNGYKTNEKKKKSKKPI